MIKKRASALPVWTQANASAGRYGAGSLVFYQADSALTASYAWRAIPSYTETTQSPDENGNWVIDPSWASDWSSEGEYIIGQRVYYFNGVRGYVYIASVRYFGGNSEPNLEVDSDGIRTWEIEMEYSTITVDSVETYPEGSSGPSVTVYEKRPIHAEFLFPVRMHGGYNGDRLDVASQFPLDPEERTQVEIPIYDATTEGNVTIARYVRDENASPAENYNDINSVYQSYPYDEATYRFYERLKDSNGNQIHLKKGIHAATYLRDYSGGIDAMAQGGDRQFAYVSSVLPRSIGGYYNAHGFSIEMWPTLKSDDYELVPSSSLHHVTGSRNHPLPCQPYHTIGVDWDISAVIPSVRDGYAPIGGFGTQNNNGGSTLHGECIYPIPPEITERIDQNETSEGDCKFQGFFYRTSPAFSERTARVYTIRTYSERKYDIQSVTFNPYSGEFTYVWNRQNIDNGFQKPDGFAALGTSPINSFQDSYTDDDALSYVTSPSDFNFNFYKYIRKQHDSLVFTVGWKLD
jgi:hypothetical protein